MRVYRHASRNGTPSWAMFERIVRRGIEPAVLAVEAPSRVAAREALRHPPHDAPHAVEVAGRDVRKAHAFKELLAEPRRRGVREEGDVALDEVAGLLDEALPRAFEPVRPFGRPGVAGCGAKVPDLGFQVPDSHLVEDPAHVDAALGEEAKPREVDRSRRRPHRRRHPGPVAVEEHPRELAGGKAVVGSGLPDGRRARFLLAREIPFRPSGRRRGGGEEGVEACEVALLLVLALGHRDGEGVPEQGAVAPPHERRGPVRVEALGDRDRDVHPPESLQEPFEALLHRKTTGSAKRGQSEVSGGTVPVRFVRPDRDLTLTPFCSTPPVAPSP